MRKNLLFTTCLLFALALPAAPALADEPTAPLTPTACVAQPLEATPASELFAPLPDGAVLPETLNADPATGDLCVDLVADTPQAVARKAMGCTTCVPQRGSIGVYPGDRAGRRAIAQWMGAAATRLGFPACMPVAAALVESGLRNLSFGDRDSVGFFQMRLSIWNRGSYRGYARDPRLQLKWFLDQAVQLKRSGRRVPRDAYGIGQSIADIERPAYQYRGRYAQQVDAAKRLL